MLKILGRPEYFFSFLPKNNAKFPKWCRFLKSIYAIKGEGATNLSPKSHIDWFLKKLQFVGKILIEVSFYVIQRDIFSGGNLSEKQGIQGILKKYQYVTILETIAIPSRLSFIGDKLIFQQDNYFRRSVKLRSYLKQKMRKVYIKTRYVLLRVPFSMQSNVYEKSR